jgi:peptide/nickel transport system ATP-binding protein
MTRPPLFELDNLRVAFRGGGPEVRAVRGISLAINNGETVGVVGESGSGKSVTFLAALGLAAPNAAVAGNVRLEGRELLALPARQRRAMLGEAMAMVFQNPVASLDPVMSIGDQLGEAIRTHHPDLNRQELARRVVALLDRVGITDPEHRARQYPHEFSGGMCQRVVIATAIANQPKVLVADEPTTAVDVTIQAQLLSLLREVSEGLNGASILVTHDLGVVAENTQRVVVMYGGRVMEEGPTREVLDSPQHPYTQGLLSCHPGLDTDVLLQPIPGNPPDPASLGDGCPFAARCPIGQAERRCHEVTPELVIRNGRLSACHFSGQQAFVPLPQVTGTSTQVAVREGDALLRGDQVRVEFRGRGLSRARRRAALVAVDDVDVTLRPGETLALVGESGSGKSTLAHTLIRLVDSEAGRIYFDSQDITHAGRRSLREMRDHVQVVFQDPYTSLNPTLTVGANAAEPLRVRGIGARARTARVAELFEEVGLSPNLTDRLPGELSGGQLQRVGIARALSVDPEVLVLDEPVSALDVSIQAQILNLLVRLQKSRNLAYLFISHDMAVVRYMAHRVAVMYLGRIVELGPARQVLGNPVHPYTEGMIAAVPTLHPRTGELERAGLTTEQSRQALTHGGCRFEPRCRLRTDACRTTDPQLVDVAPAHQVACIVRAPLPQENHVVPQAR